jgi:hypothetical protein
MQCEFGTTFIVFKLHTRIYTIVDVLYLLNFKYLDVIFFSMYTVHLISQPISNFIRLSSFLSIYIMGAMRTFLSVFVTL